LTHSVGAAGEGILVVGVAGEDLSFGDLGEVPAVVCERGVLGFVGRDWGEEEEEHTVKSREE
jgi:hypothetical protein